MKTVEELQALMLELSYEERELLTDAYHSFKELYEFRLIYNASLLNEWAAQNKFNVHKSKKHFDGVECFGGKYFIVMATLPTGQISNHYPLEDWDLFKCPEKETADHWDGHSSADVVERIKKYIQSQN